MTALVRPQIDRHDPLSTLRGRGSERGILTIALGAAVALHLAALLLPLPSRSAAPLPKPRPRTDRRIWVEPIPPPELPDIPVAAAAPAARPLPLPMPEAPAPEPVAEPLAVSPIEPLGESLLEPAEFVPLPPPQEQGILPEGTPGLIPPRLVSKCAEPLYPAMAVHARLEGVVVLRAVITEQGDVESIELLEAPRPDLGFSESAMAAMSCWKYEPGSYRGRAVAVSLRVIVEFEID